ncbi:hypothetical protein PGT21_022362 [Puccinia graminis f. sp. tritici]|uniref:Uncharacterized protein n=1 Tax=Puccinia graminis f. sp. tritici TaxID=56615 RepID=A0A5B0PFP6_PUCGR|nr:hypothetical protein PGT21_022362 [Puccinia graminis f. sp. tritici]
MDGLALPSGFSNMQVASNGCSLQGQGRMASGTSDWVSKCHPPRPVVYVWCCKPVWALAQGPRVQVSPGLGPLPRGLELEVRAWPGSWHKPKSGLAEPKLWAHQNHQPQNPTQPPHPTPTSTTHWFWPGWHSRLGSAKLDFGPTHPNFGRCQARLEYRPSWA